MKKPKLWYVIADGGRARFVERDEDGAFRTLSSFVSTELHMSAHELGRDLPARVKESASPARSAVEPRRDLHEAAKEDFIRTVADTLAGELKDGKFDELVLDRLAAVAEPAFEAVAEAGPEQLAWPVVTGEADCTGIAPTAPPGGMPADVLPEFSRLIVERTGVVACALEGGRVFIVPGAGDLIERMLRQPDFDEAFEPLDDRYPSTMSRKVLHALLRERLGFQGVIISDALEMKAIAANFPVDEVVTRGVDAGIDLFAPCEESDLRDRAIDALVRAAERGDVSRERLVESGRRIDALALKYAKPPVGPEARKVIGSAEHRAVVERVLERAQDSSVGQADPTAHRLV